MSFPKRGRSKNDPIIIRRSNPKEMQQAVSDLIARGYVVIKEGVDYTKDIGGDLRRTANLTRNISKCTDRKRELEPNDTVKMYTVMQRKELVNGAISNNN